MQRSFAEAASVPVERPQERTAASARRDERESMSTSEGAVEHPGVSGRSFVKSLSKERA